MKEDDPLQNPFPELQKLWAAEKEVLSRPLSTEEIKGFGKEKRKQPNPKPFVHFEDLNNKTEKDILDCNPPRPAMSIGLEWSF